MVIKIVESQNIIVSLYLYPKRYAYNVSYTQTIELTLKDFITLIVKWSRVLSFETNIPFNYSDVQRVLRQLT